jgi:hypothetical protein
VSPSDQPLQIHITLSREEAIDYLRGLAHDPEVRERFESNPYEALRENGIEVTPAEAVPSSVTAPSAEEIESTIESIGYDPQEAGWNVMMRWAYFPFIALFGKPMGGGAEAD